MKDLLKLREQLLSDLAAIERILALIGEPATATNGAKAGLSRTLLELAERQPGFTTAEIIDPLVQAGWRRTSIYSALNRLKRQGQLILKGGKYYRGSKG